MVAQCCDRWRRAPTRRQDAARPNILWLTSEDHGPHMGCYGDTFATTPNVDRLAAKGMIYTHAWSCAPVCAPARTTLISGMYPPSTGSEHMRSMVAYPAGKKMFPQLLRAAGYYCTNNAKEDYNLAQPGQVWDESSRQAHWKNRSSGQPFFAVFNSEKSHESRIRKRPHAAVHDPAKVRVPAYHPDTPEVRQDWAQYYDVVTRRRCRRGRPAGASWTQAGLADDTIVFYFADHGSGMPRNKRWPYNCGLHVPLVVYIPPKFQHLRPSDYEAGGKSDRLVSFVDFAPSVLSLAGIEPPEWMQGHAFLGEYAAPPQPYVYGFRGRMDERYDLVRSVTDGRYVYIRNYMPHRIYGQHLAYMFQTPTTRVWRQLHRRGQAERGPGRFLEHEAARGALRPGRRSGRSPQPGQISAEHRDALAKLRDAQQRSGRCESATSDFCPRARFTPAPRERRPTTWGTTRRSIRSSGSSPPPNWQRTSSRDGRIAECGAWRRRQRRALLGGARPADAGAGWDRIRPGRADRRARRSLALRSRRGRRSPGTLWRQRRAIDCNERAQRVGGLGAQQRLCRDVRAQCPRRTGGACRAGQGKAAPITPNRALAPCSLCGVCAAAAGRAK